MEVFVDILLLCCVLRLENRDGGVVIGGRSGDKNRFGVILSSLL